MTITLIKTKKASLAAAILAVLVLSIVLLTFTEVTVGSVAPLQGVVTYSLDNVEAGPWTVTLTPNGPSEPWYSRLEIKSAEYSGRVTITWKLQQKTGFSSWTDVSGAQMSTSTSLSGGVQSVYATCDGSYSTGNYDWGQAVTVSGTYRVVAIVMG